MDLYRRRGGAPAPLPATAMTDDGFSRTDLANQPESRAELGFVFFASLDPETQQLVERDGAWHIADIAGVPVPGTVSAVTMRQAKLALRRTGHLAAAQAALDAMPGDEGEDARIEWTAAKDLRRDHPMVAALGAVLGLDEAAIDDLFVQAAQID